MRSSGRTCGCGHDKQEHRPACSGRHQDIPCGCKSFVHKRGEEVPVALKGDAEPTVTK